MKLKNFRMLKHLLLLFVFTSVILSACKDDEPVITEPVASFQFAISETDYLEVTFTNYSQNAETYSWDFGDGETSGDENPVHTFAEAGTYTVTLTAYNSAGASSDYSKEIQITDPNVAQTLLTGDVSKTWKLYRVGTSLGVGPDEAGARTWWSLTNDGSRPCVYKHEFTFTADGNFIFNDNGWFWREEAVFADPQKATCFEATPANMINKDGADVSAWLSGTHSFTYDVAASTVTLNGNGAWMGLPQLGTSADNEYTPVTSKTFAVSIEEFDGYDLLHVTYNYPGTPLYWDFTYVSYDNWADEPELVTEEIPWGTDFPDTNPTELSRKFESADAADFVLLDTVQSASTIIYGVDNPADAGATKVGQFNRTADMYQELQFQTSPTKYDIDFTGLTTITSMYISRSQIITQAL